MEKHRDQLKETVVWNAEKGPVSMKDHVDACYQQARMFAELQDFMSDIEFLACPVTQVPPFAKGIEYIKEIEGIHFDTYLD